jgi:hypothetical protein
LTLDAKISLLKPGSHRFRMKIKVQGGELHRLRSKGAPRLALEYITQDRLQILLISIFQYKGPLRAQDSAHLGQGARGIYDMMQDTNHSGDIKQTCNERQSINVCRHVLIALATSQAFLSLL